MGLELRFLLAACFTIIVNGRRTDFWTLLLFIYSCYYGSCINRHYLQETEIYRKLSLYQFSSKNLYIFAM